MYLGVPDLEKFYYLDEKYKHVWYHDLENFHYLQERYEHVLYQAASASALLVPHILSVKENVFLLSFSSWFVKTYIFET